MLFFTKNHNLKRLPKKKSDAKANEKVKIPSLMYKLVTYGSYSFSRYHPLLGIPIACLNLKRISTLPVVV